MCGETRCARFAACAARRMVVEALKRDRADPAGRGRAVERNLERPARGGPDPVCIESLDCERIRPARFSLRPLPKAHDGHLPIEIEIVGAQGNGLGHARAPVAYRSSTARRRAAHRAVVGVGPRPANAPTSSTDGALGRWLPWRGARSCAVTSTLRTPPPAHTCAVP